MQNCSGIGCIENYQIQFHGPGQVAKWFFFLCFLVNIPRRRVPFLLAASMATAGGK
jgi:hypothetical protein